MVVTATGMDTEMGRIATMLTSVERTRSPLQRELGDLTKVLGRHRLGRGGVHRGRRARPRDGRSGAAAARDGDGDLGDPDRHAGVRLRAAVDGRQAAGRGEGGREEPDRRRDARRDQRDQHRQDRHADAERDDGLDDLRLRLVVPGDRRGLPQDRRDRVGRRHARPGLHAPGARPGARQRRDRRRRRRRRRRPDRGGARRARRQARRERRGDAPRLPAPGRGAVRLGLQVHGDLPPRHARRRRARRRARQGRPGRGPRPLRLGRRPAERLAGPDRRGAGGARRGEPADGRAGPARARLRRSHRRTTSDQATMLDGPDGAHAGARVRRHGRDDRPAAAGGQGGGRHRALGRDRRADDHRRQRDHRRRDRREPRPRPGRDQRRGVPGALRRGGPRPPARACTSSAASHPRTSCGSRGSCRARA